MIIDYFWTDPNLIQCQINGAYWMVWSLSLYPNEWSYLIMSILELKKSDHGYRSDFEVDAQSNWHLITDKTMQNFKELFKLLVL